LVEELCIKILLLKIHFSNNTVMKLLLISVFTLLALGACHTSKKCVETPNANCVCTMDYNPVCGCNGKTYPNACSAECVGIKKYTMGACEDAKQSGASLEGTMWQLVTIAVTPQPVTMPETLKKPVTVKFENEKISGFGGCNSYGGSYAKNLKKITLTGVFSTHMYCNETSGLEKQYFDVLQKAEHFDIKGDRLEIYCGDLGSLVFTATK